MGSPLSPVLAELYMKNFEQVVKAIPEFYNYVRKWNRYVDDVLSAVRGDISQCQELLDRLNQIDSHIQFTCEIEKEKRLPFLDLLISHQQGKLHFCMYSKPTSADFLLNYKSCHDPQVKINIIRNETDRIQTCSDEPKADITKLKVKLRRNGYPAKIVKENTDLATNRTKKKEVDKEKDPRPLLVLPYKLGVTSKLKRKYKKKTKIVYTKGKQLKHIFSKNYKDQAARDTNAIYSIKCGCDAEYIGESGRELKIRQNEHMKAVKNGNTNYALADHSLKTNHKIDWSSTKILGKEDHWMKRKIKEALLIKEKNPELNLNTGFALKIV